MNKITNPMTYGEAADVVNACDEQDIMIYFDWTDNFKIPVDNYEFFKMLTNEDPDENFPMCLSEDEDGNVKLSDLD
jgi:hypothetical protein